MTLIFINLKALLRKMGMFFYLIVIVFVFTTISLQYAYGFLKSYIEYRNYRTESVRAYVIENKDITKDELDNYILNNKKDLRRVYALINNKDGATIAVYYGESATKFKAVYGNSASRLNEIIVPEKDKNNRYYNIGDSYIFLNNTYKITGISFTNTYEMLYEPSLNKDNLVTGWVIVSEELLTGYNQKEFISNIKASLKTDSLELPQTEKAETGNNIIYVIIISLTVLGTINLTFIYYCLLKRRRKQQAVFHILGCGIPKIYGLYIGEILLITTVLYLACSFFTQYILFDIMNRFSTILSLKLEIKDYFFLYFILVLFMVLILIWQTSLHFKRTPYEMKRR